MDKLSLNGYMKEVKADAKTKEEYRKRYEEVRDKIATRWFTVKATNRIVVHLRIPSEKVKMNYDVLVEFQFGRANGSFKNFRTDDIRVYSNCPSFVFMNARVFDRKGFLIPWAKQLYDKATLEPPADKAKKEEELKKDVKYEKSLYFTALYLTELNPIQVLTEIRESTNVPRVEAIVQYMRSPEKAMQVRTKRSEKDKKKRQGHSDKKETVVTTKDGSISTDKNKVARVQRVSKVGSVNKVKHI